MTLEEICLHQWTRPEKSLSNLRPQGYGDCKKCEPDEKNKNCKGYTPIKIQSYEVN